MRKLIEPTIEGACRSELAILEAGYVFEREYNIATHSGSSAYNARIDSLRASSLDFRHLLVDEGRKVRIFLRSKTVSKRAGSDVDWEQPLEDIRGRVENVLK